MVILYISFFFFFIHHQPFWPVQLSSSLAGHPSKPTKPNTSTQTHLNQHVVPFFTTVAECLFHKRGGQHSCSNCTSAKSSV